MKKATAAVLAAIATLGLAPEAMAQAAGAGADYNREESQRLAEERARQAAFDAEVRRLEQIDKPLQNDVLGNVLTSGGGQLLVRGAQAAATSLVTGTVGGVAVEKGKAYMGGDSSAGAGESE